VKIVRKIISCILLVSLMATLTATVFATPVDKGNGAPNGPHYNLNIIGVPKEKKGEMSGNGNVIFVKLWGADTKISLVPGDDFAVLDKDGTDGRAELQLMDPYPEDESPGINTGEEPIYRIYIRALGKPGGEMGMTSGFTDEYNVNWYSLESINLTRNHGRSRFTDKTLELTTIYVDMDGDGTPTRYNLFGNELWDYFWDYDNSGLKLLQMRIYVE
jgi:hypothetical protein